MHLTAPKVRCDSRESRQPRQGHSIANKPISEPPDCQAEHWPTHKGLCSVTRHKIIFPQCQWFKSLPDNEVSIGMIIDTFRMRCEDDYVHGCHNHGIYGGEDPWPVFKDFLDRAEAMGQMPPWWTPAKRTRCNEVAARNDDFAIRYCVEKPDIQEHYKDPTMPMRLRMMAENIYGGGYGLGQTPMPKGFQCFCQP